MGGTLNQLTKSRANITPTSTCVTLKVRVPTNCHVGPGNAYEQISVLHTGKTVKVIARDANADYWVIENPEGSGTCWVWDYYATVSGLIETLPVWAAPPTPTPTKLSLHVSVDTNCCSGPGKAYDIIIILRIGKTAEVVGRNVDGSCWVIQNPAGSGQCWVRGDYAVLSGPVANLPLWDKPPTPTPTPKS